MAKNSNNYSTVFSLGIIALGGTILYSLLSNKDTDKINQSEAQLKVDEANAILDDIDNGIITEATYTQAFTLINRIVRAGYNIQFNPTTRRFDMVSL